MDCIKQGGTSGDEGGGGGGGGGGWGGSNRVAGRMNTSKGAQKASNGYKECVFVILD